MLFTMTHEPNLNPPEPDYAHDDFLQELQSTFWGWWPTFINCDVFDTIFDKWADNIGRFQADSISELYDKIYTAWESFKDEMLFELGYKDEEGNYTGK